MPGDPDAVSDRAAAVRGEGEGVRRGHPGKGGDMTEYLIAFNDEWVPDHTVEELREKSKAVRALSSASMEPVSLVGSGVCSFTSNLRKRLTIW